jgi:uncharacterized DUF497 family protein
MAIVIKKLVWDNWNVAHIARHNVIPKEVEEVCKGKYISYESHDGRFEVIGATQQGRTLLVVVDPEPAEGEYYVVTAYTANKQDRALYQQNEGGENAA